MTIGERIYYCRTENHMTQKELGEKTGIDSATIGKYERGVLNPKISTLQKIADALGCKVTDLDDSLATSINETVNSMISPEIKAHIADSAQNALKASMTPEMKASIDALANKVALIYQEHANTQKSTEEQMLQYFRDLNDTGQQVAVERVQELSQIPKYQRPPDVPQDAPGGSDDKEPTEK